MNPTRRISPADWLRPWRALLLIAALMLTAAALASDENVQPLQEQVSPDRTWRVRIESRIHAGASSAVADWYQGNGRGDYRHLTTAPLKNYTAPVLAYVTNTGALVTMGDEGNDRALMLVIYSPDGRLVQSWPLIMLFRSDYLTCLLHKADEESGDDAVGPLYWLSTSGRFSEREGRVYVRDRLSGSLEINTQNGDIKSLEVPCSFPLGEMTWELGDSPQWKPSRHLPSAFLGKTYLLKVFANMDRKWRLEQIEYAGTEHSTYEGLAQMLSSGARVTGRGEALGLPVLYSELFEEDDGIKQVSAVSGDNTRALRLSIVWRPGTVDETAAVTAELKALMAGIRRINAPRAGDAKSDAESGR